MQIEITTLAAEQIRNQLHEQSATLKLAYDTEGCGCVVSGVAALWVVDGPGEFDRQAENSSFELLYDWRHEVFFEERLIIDYLPQHRSYILKSNQQIYNARMSLIDNRNK